MAFQIWAGEASLPKDLSHFTLMVKVFVSPPSILDSSTLCQAAVAFARTVGASLAFRIEDCKEMVSWLGVALPLL